MILEPANVSVIERAVGHDEDTKALLLTAQIRGWVEILHENMPTGQINDVGGFSSDQLFQSVENHWKLTDFGWAAIKRRHQIFIFTLAITFLGVYITLNA